MTLTREDFTADEWRARRLTLRVVLRAVSEASGFRVDLLKSHRRHNKKVLDARWVAMCLMAEIFPDATFREIGAAINRDGTSIGHALRKIDTKKEELWRLAAEAVEILRQREARVAEEKPAEEKAEEPPQKEIVVKPEPEPAKTYHYPYRKPQPREDDEKERTCLSCLEPFHSKHVGNRVCKRCLNSEAFRGSHAGIVTNKDWEKQKDEKQGALTLPGSGSHIPTRRGVS